jgi:hypothetical protein
LGIREPEVEDSIEVLAELAQHPPRDEDIGVLIDTYRHLATLTPKDRSQREALARVPLWGGDGWLTTRPIFAIGDGQLAEALAEHEPTWLAPVPVETLGTLPTSLGVTVLDVGRFSAIGIDGEALAHGARLAAQYQRAVGHLRARFVRGDQVAFEQLRPGWPALQDTHLAITPHLAIEIKIVGRQEATLPIAAHVQETAGRLVFAVRSSEDAGQETAGGRAIASLFGIDGSDRNVDREKVALAWAAAWASAAAGVSPEEVVLAGSSEAASDPLEGLQDDIRKARQWRTTKDPLQRSAIKEIPEPPNPEASLPIQGESQAPIAMRRLKRIEELEIGDVALVGASKRKKPRTGRNGNRPLADPPADHGRNPPLQERTLLRGYSDQEREKLAVDVLKRILETDRRTLRDLRKVARLGADVVDNLNKYFEIKSSAGDMPDVISLRHSELERSTERPAGHWFLAVVAGLEDGFETTVRFIADPLKHLEWADSGSVTLSGVRSAPALEVPLPSRSEPEAE